VLFRPLDQAELVQVVDLNLIQINRSLANQKVSVELSPEAKQWLAQTGYDPRLGARPLRRLIQRTVENVVAQHVLNGQAIPGSTLSLGLDELKNANNDKSSHV
jgi:ATP-dependent Clp protease ATP-binding subunit ClpA